jgi:hypothetical protein
MLAQLGIDIHRDVLINMAIKVALQLRVIVQNMAQQILKAELVHIDETPCVVGVKDGKRTKWCFRLSGGHSRWEGLRVEIETSQVKEDRGSEPGAMPEATCSLLQRLNPGVDSFSLGISYVLDDSIDDSIDVLPDHASNFLDRLQA